MLLLSAALLFPLAGCAGSQAPKQFLPTRASPVSAAREIQSFERVRSPGLAQLDPPPVTETTPEGLWEAMRAQTFRVDEGLFAGETYAVAGGSVVRLGAAYQGPGVIATHLGDADFDGEPDLAYAAGARSGLMRYGIGLVDRPGYQDPPPGAPPPADPADLRHRTIAFTYRDPVRFQASEVGLEVWDEMKNVRLGRLVAVGEQIRFLPDAELPRNVRERFLEPRL